MAKSVACLLMTLIAAQALAAEPKPTPKGGTLDRAGAQACADLNSQIGRDIDAFNREVKKENALVDEMNTLRKELPELEKLVDPDNKDQMALYQGKVDRHNGLVTEINAIRNDLKAREDATNALKTRFNARCAGRLFRQDDVKRPKTGR